MNWHEINFLESASNVKALVKDSIGVEPNSKTAMIYRYVYSKENVF